VRTNIIIEKLSQSGRGAVLPEEYKKYSRTKIRLWMLVSNLKDEEKKELRRIFPSLEKRGILFKLGECTSLSLANGRIARAREKALSGVCRKLFLLPPKRAIPPKPKTFGIVRNSRGRAAVF